MSLNISLLRKALEYAESHPEEIELSSWAARSSCGTTRCIAGTVVWLAGHEIDWDREHLEHQVYYCSDGRMIADVAAEELGITQAQEDKLFYCSDMDQVWEVAEKVTNGEIKRSIDQTS